jgi:hypothetical protein
MGRVGNPVGAVLTALVVLSVGQALAQEYCVACSGPDALYRCVIDGAQPRGGQPLQMLCVTAMAKQGGHATCGVKRGTVFDCNGLVKHVPWTTTETPRAPDAAQPLPWASQPAPRPEPAATPPPAVPSLAPPAQPVPAPDQPPQTVLEMAKRANEDTAKQMKKAGETVGKAGETMKQATKKTWDCVVSFFTKC